MDLNETNKSLDLPLRIGTLASAFDVHVIYDSNSQVVREMDDYEEAVRYVAAANGTSIDAVHSDVARRTQMYTEYMQNLKENRKVGHASSTTVAVSQAMRRAEEPSREYAIAAVRQLLELTHRGDEPDSLQLVIRSLQGLQEADQYAFYLGRPRRPLDEIWGDNDRSFVAEICGVPIGHGEEAFVTILKQDGGISRYLGTFTTHDAALKCLARHGKFEKP